LIKTTTLVKPNTTNTSMSYNLSFHNNPQTTPTPHKNTTITNKPAISYLFYTSIYELALTPLGPKVAYAATSSVTTTFAGRPRLTAPPFNLALAANSFNRICLAEFGLIGRPCPPIPNVLLIA